jgi:sugar phosphate isomerase/epimerase
MSLKMGIEAGGDTVALAKEAHFKGVPITLDDLIRDGVEKTLLPLQEAGLAPCQVGAFGFNPLHPDREYREEMDRRMQKAIPLAQKAGCPWIVINGGNLHPSGFLHGDPWNFTREARTTVAQRLQPLLKQAEQHGVRISIEPYIKSCVCSVEAFLDIREQTGSEALRINIDVTNFYDLGDMWDPSPKIRDVCRGLEGHYGLVHLKEVALREGFHIHIDLAPFDKGPTPWDLVLREIAPRTPADAWVILEHITSIEDGRRALALLRQCAANAGVSLNPPLHHG